MPSNQGINLFIDANIWLSLFHFSSDDLEQFRKLKSHLGHGINIYAPQQIRDEVFRNRENKIKDSLDKFAKFELPFPAYLKNYEEYSGFHKRFNALKGEHKEWLEKIKRDIASQSLPADVVLREVFDSIQFIPSTAELVEKGVMRYNIGNPPGKNHKYGDAINWETLLAAVPDGEALYFISADKDYASLYDSKGFHPFLAQEWSEKKHSNIFFYTALTDFFNKHVRDIQLQAENEKNELIEDLAFSRSFRTTHGLIERMAKLSGWSLRQIQDICSAALENFQVKWIITDGDVSQFFNQLLDNEAVRNCGDKAVEEVLKMLKPEYAGNTSDDSELDLPF